MPNNGNFIPHMMVCILKPKITYRMMTRDVFRNLVQYEHANCYLIIQQLHFCTTSSVEHFHCEDKKRADWFDCKAEYLRVLWAVTAAKLYNQ